MFAVPVTIALGLEANYLLLQVNMLIAGIGVLGGQIGLNALCGTIYPTYMRAMGAGWALGIGRIGAIVGPDHRRLSAGDRSRSARSCCS